MSLKNNTTTQSLILLADDGIDNQRLVAFFLERAGYEVHTVNDGLSAVESVNQQIQNGRGYDMILMDMQMPKMDGFEATRQIRQMGYQRPIVALTASSLPADRQTCIDAGCDDYLAKPFDFQPLLDLVAAKLNVSA